MLSPRVHSWLARLLWAVGVFAMLFLAAAVVFLRCSRPVKLLFSPTAEATRHPMQADGVANYARDEVDTFYTFPEWYIVWSYQAKADFQQTHLPSGYSYFGDIGRFWQAYSRMYAATRRVYPFPVGDHIMLVDLLQIQKTAPGFHDNSFGRHPIS